MPRTGSRWRRDSLPVAARTAVEAFPHFGWVAEASGRALYFNRRAVELTGLPEESLLGAGWTKTVHPADLNRLFGLWVDAVRQGETFEAEFRVRDGSGHYHLVVGRAAPLGDGGTARLWIGTCTLATEGPRLIRLPDLLPADQAGSIDWSSAVLAAIARDELICATQPIVGLRGGRPSEELLVRLASSTGAEISPTVFMPSIEASGAVVDVDRWMLHQAIDRAALGVRVHVNVSPRSLDDPELLELIPRLLAERSVAPADLVFELTETASIRDLDRAVRFSEMLASLGCGLALDDFGSGYAAFGQLATLSITHLKISHEFVADMRSNPCHRHIVDIVVELARRFDCETVAEGVEDEATLRLLGRRGIDYAQGFHLGRPTALLAVERPA